MSEQTFDALAVLNALPGNHLILLPDAPVFTIAGVTDAYLQVTYTRREAILNKGVFEVLPDDVNNPLATGVVNLSASLHQVMASKSPHRMNPQRYDVFNPQAGVFVRKVWNPTNQPVLTLDGQVQYIIHTVDDVTEQMQRQEDLAESEARFGNMIHQAPAAMMVLIGDDLVVSAVNHSMLRFLNLDMAILGKPFEVALPEAVGHHLVVQLRKVLRTGIPYYGWGEAVEVLHKGQIQTGYFNVSYTPYYEQGQIAGVMQVATNVTKQIVAQRALIEKSQDLELAMAVAKLGSFKINLITQQATYSPRVMEWFGLTEQNQSVNEMNARVWEPDRAYVVEALSRTIAGENEGYHDLTYQIVNPSDGQLRHLHSLGQVVWEDGVAVSMTGIIRDVTQELTSQRELQMLLEQQVQQRTLDLQRSNDNLQQFAYIASHHLQEPLRKIQSFSHLLKRQYSQALGDPGLGLLQRIQTSGERMSALTKDLLSYSRIPIQQQVFDRVSLDAILATVLNTLGPAIQARQARIEVSDLGSVPGDETQLNQLFENLLSNALKFTPKDQQPRIRVAIVRYERSKLPPEVQPVSEAQQFCQICVSDQGVGFDTKYRKRIFEVFQRLHNRDEFPGTGVGLAICKRVAENHGGTITASSSPGEGTTFCVYLPT